MGVPAGLLPEVTAREREQRRAAKAGPAPAGLLPQAAADGKTVRGAIPADGSQVHLLSVFDVAKRSPEFAASYAAIANRRGRKIATIAIVRKLLTRAWHLLAELEQPGEASTPPRRSLC